MQFEELFSMRVSVSFRHTCFNCPDVRTSHVRHSVSDCLDFPFPSSGPTSPISCFRFPRPNARYPNFHSRFYNFKFRLSTFEVHLNVPFFVFFPNPIMPIPEKCPSSSSRRAVEQLCVCGAHNKESNVKRVCQDAQEQV